MEARVRGLLLTCQVVSSFCGWQLFCFIKDASTGYLSVAGSADRGGTSGQGVIITWLRG